MVRFGDLEAMEAAISTAHEAISTTVSGALDRVNTEIAGWDPGTASRAAEMQHQQDLRNGVDRLTEALERVRATLASIRTEAHDTEVRNVAEIG